MRETYWRDSATGLDYADQRYYSNQFARFMTPDSSGVRSVDPGSWNKYTYAGDDPINHLDPLGRDWCWPDDFGGGCFVVSPGANPGDFSLNIGLQIANAIAAAALIGADIAKQIQAAKPDCTVEVSYRPVYLNVNGVMVNSGKNHTIVSTIVSGVRTVYEGEPDPSPALPNGQPCDPRTGSCPTNSLLVGVTTATGVNGLGTKWATIKDAGFDCAGIALTNINYNSHKLHYADFAEPNSNSYAYTLLATVGLSGDVDPPPDTPGWGYNLIVNPSGITKDEEALDKDD